MRGRVLWYQPYEGTGILEADGGQEVAFAQAEDDQHLRGGDIVEFGLSGTDGNATAHDIRLIRRCVDDLVAHHEPLVNLFHETVLAERI
jgi:cold shock CspA family protein